MKGIPISRKSKWGRVMLAKCTNLFCCARFRLLRDDKLFRLESDPVVCTDQPNQPKYLCLCHRCSSTMSLRLLEDGTVVATLLPEPVGRDRDDVVLRLVDRKNGLILLRSSFRCRSTSEIA